MSNHKDWRRTRASAPEIPRAQKCAYIGCDREFQSTREDPNIYCETHRTETVKCEVCPVTKTRKRERYGSSFMCDGCNTKKSAIQSKRTDDPCFSDKKNYVLKIHYRKTEHDHSGYCSDPGDKSEDRVKIREYDEYYPILKMFTKAEFAPDGSLDIENPKLRLYRTLQDHEHGCCSRGKSELEIVEAKIVHNMRDEFFDT